MSFKYKFALYASVLPKVTELAEAVTKNFQALTGGKQELLMGYKVGVITITSPVPCTKDKAEMKKRLLEAVKKSDAETGNKLGKIWIEEVRDGKE